MQVQKPKIGYKLVPTIFGRREQIPEDWEYSKLSDLVEKENDIVAGPFGSNLKVSDYVPNGVPIIRLQNIERNQFIPKNIQFISDEKAKELNYHSYQPNDIVLAKLGEPIGKTCKIPENMPAGIVVADVVRIRPSQKKSNSKFVEYVLNSKICERQLNRETIGTTRQRVNLFQIRNLTFPCPSLLEQQKIASILSNVDSLIQQTQKIINQTQKLKKGLMQKLLTKGIGHTKFKKTKLGEIPEEWEFRKLTDVGEIVGGGTPDSFNSEYWNGDILWAVPTDVTSLSTIYINDTERKISKKGLDESSAKLLPEGTILITSRATIGECVINTKPMATNQGFQSLICNSKNDNLFIFYAIKFNKNRLFRLSYGTTFLEISKSEMKKVTIPIPPLPEQQKISNILSNVDLQIQKQQEYKSKLETLKKGLMQKLLTGQIRVNA